jgi:hypothetical protein
LESLCHQLKLVKNLVQSLVLAFKTLLAVTFQQHFKLLTDKHSRLQRLTGNNLTLVPVAKAFWLDLFYLF